MPNNYQIYYEIKALDKASAIFDKVDKRIKQMNKNLQSSQKYHKKLAVSQKLTKGFVEKEIQGRARVNEKLLAQTRIENILERNQKAKRSAWAAEINHLEKIDQKKKLNSEKELRRIKKEQEANRRSTEKRIKDQQRLNLQKAQFRYGQSERGYQSARSAMMYAAAPTALAVGASLRNTMSMEQLDISLNTLFGEGAKKIGDELKKYAFETQFTLRESTQLLLDIKKGSKKLGIQNPSDMIEIMKMIGNTILPYATKPEDKQEIAYQIGQGMMRGRFSERQDIRVMAAKGLPVYAAVEKVMGMSWEDVKSKYGAEIPAPIIMKALEYMSKSPEVARSLALRSKSLTISWEQFKESVFYVSSEYGNILDRSFSIRKVLQSTAKIMFDHYNDLEKGQGKGLANTIKLGIVMSTLVPTITLAVFGIKKMRDYMALTRLQTTGLGANIRQIGRTYRMISMGVSALYLATTDWNKVIKDIKEDGLKGSIQHLDVLISGFILLSGVANLFKNSLAASLLSARGIASTLAPLTAGYLGGKYLMGKYSDYVDKKELEKMGIDPLLQKRNKERLKREQIVLNNNITANVVQDKNGMFSIKDIESKVTTKDPLANPIYVHDIGD